MDSQVAMIRQGSTRAVAQALTELENGPTPIGIELLRRLYPETGNGFILGVTGSPGVGKSTLVERLAQHYSVAGKKVGIVAVDPSSPFTGGAILGDRVRMDRLSEDPNVFIRSMATRGRVGGLTGSIDEVLIVLEAAGFTSLIVETVGVGQDEVEVVATADVTVVVLVPGMGDSVQVIKAGIMEIGDVFVINKADRDGASRLEQELKGLLSTDSRSDGWVPPIVRTVATSGENIKELAEAIEECRKFLDRNPAARERALRLASQRLIRMIRERFSSRLLARISTEKLREYAQRLMEHQQDPYSITDEMVEEMGLGGIFNG